MKPYQKVLSFVLCLILLSSASIPALAASKQPKTAEELGYLPAGELLAEDGKTIKFNDPAVQKALEQQYPHLMEADGTFLADSLKRVTSLVIGVDIIDSDRGAYMDIWIAAYNGENFTAELEQVDVSVLQFCTQLYSVTCIAQKVDSLAAFSQSKSKYKHLTFIGGKGLKLDGCPSVTNLANLDLMACEVESYEPLVLCKKLNYVRLSGENATDLTVFAQIPKLTGLELAYAPNADLTPLLNKRSFDSLSLDMAGATADDIRWQLAQKAKYWFEAYNCTEITAEIVETYLPKTASLNFTYTELPAQAVDFSALQGSKKLDTLYFSKANIQSLSFLADLSKLTHLYFYNSQVEDASGVFSAPKLTSLHIFDCSVKNWDSFDEPVKAKKLSEVNIEASNFTNLSFVNGLSLKYLWLHDNGITDLSPLTQAKKIERLSLADNPIADFSPLTGVKGLKMVQHNSSETLPEMRKVTVEEGDFDMWFFD